MEPTVVFDYQIMMLNLNEVIAKLEDPPVQELCDMLRETLKIFQQMGGALAMAFADIIDKINIIKRCKWTLEKEASTSEAAGLKTLMRKEIDLNIHILNGENSVQMGETREAYRFYESISRTMVRIGWFLNFVLYLLQGLYRDRKKYSATCCSEAYSKAFGDHHKFHIRMAAKGAMLMAPSRARMLEIFISEKNEEKAYETISTVMNNMEILCESVWTFLTDNKLENLP